MKRITLLVVVALSILGLIHAPHPAGSQRTVPQGAWRTVLLTCIVRLERLAPEAPAQCVTLYIPLPDRTYVTHAWVTADGVATFRVPPGTYLATLRSAKWLSRRMAIDTRSRSAQSEVLLLGGDANGDDCVDWPDMDILAEAYQTQEGDAEFDPRADFDCDGDVDDYDGDILYANLFCQGEG